MKRKNNINRRSAMKTIGALGVASTLVSGKAFGQTTKATVFACIGDGAHPFDMIKTALDANIAKGLNITIDYSNDTAMLNDSKLDGYRLLIIALDAFRELEKAKAIQAFVQNGGGFLILHNSTNNANRSGSPDIMRDIIGGHWLYHSGVKAHSKAVRPYKVKITNKNHPITNGVNDFETIGEHHYNQYDKDPRYVFMTNDTIDGWAYNNIVGDKHYDERLGDRGYGASCPSGWAYDYGKGRVCFLAPGHTLDEYMNPEYIKLQKNAIRWCLKQI